jgi:phosphate uptake regulator
LYIKKEKLKYLLRLKENMKRKVIKQGTQALTISLPRKWTEMYNVKPKDELDVEEKGGQLIIQTSAEVAPKTESLDLQGMSTEILHRYIIASYKKGADEISIKFDPKTMHTKTGEMRSTLAYIQKIVQERLIGLEIVEQKDNKCRIKQITHIAPEDFDVILRRIFLLVMSITEDVLQMIESKSRDYEIVKTKHDQIEKFVNYTIRILNKRGFDENTGPYHIIITQLEEISDVYAFVTRDIIEEKRKYDAKTVGTMEATNEAVRAFYEFYYHPDNEKAKSIMKMRRDLLERGNALVNVKSADAAVFLSRLNLVAVILLNLVEARLEMA